MKFLKLALFSVLFSMVALVAFAADAVDVLPQTTDAAITAGPLAAIIALLPESIAGYIGNGLAWLSGIITIATIIVQIWPSEKATGILGKLRSLISVLSGNILNNK